MAVFQDGKNLWLYKGDTGNVIFSGLPTDKIYTFYMSIYDQDNEKILKEFSNSSFDQTNGTATFIFDEDKSNDLKVGDFTYGLKCCASDGSEDTLIPETTLEDGSYVAQDAPTFTVKAKVVEGN